MGLEQEREAVLRELRGEHGQEYLDQFKPGSFGCHELLDRVSLFLRLLEEQVENHPACVQNTEWFAQARKAVDVLAELYQSIGREHLADNGQVSFTQRSPHAPCAKNSGDQ